jgi:hypothetical protein
MRELNISSKKPHPSRNVVPRKVYKGKKLHLSPFSITLPSTKSRFL